MTDPREEGAKGTFSVFGVFRAIRDLWRAIKEAAEFDTSQDGDQT